MIALLIAVPLVFAFASIPHERLGRYFLPFVAMFNLSLILAIFFAIWLSSRRDNAFISIYLAGLGFFLVTSLILFPGWIPQWFASFIRVHPDLSWVKTPLMDIAAIFPGAYRPLAISLHVLVLLCYWWSGMAYPRVATGRSAGKHS